MRLAIVVAAAAACAGPNRIISEPGRSHARKAPRTVQDAQSDLAAARTQGDAAAAARSLCEVESLGGGAPREDELRSLVDELDVETLRSLAETSCALAPLSALRLALFESHAGRQAAAERWLERAGEVEGAGELAASLRRRGRGRAGRIALLVPTSGSHRHLGDEIAFAVELAAEGRNDVEVRVFDTAADERGAEEAVERAAEWGAAAILGPVGAGTSEAAAYRAQSIGVPMFSLSPSGPLAPAAGIYRLWMSPEWEASQVAYAAIELGFAAPAVFYPRDDVGRVRARAFIDTVRERGLEVVHGAYDPTGTELEADVRRFLGLDPMRNERLRRHLSAGGKKALKSFVPDVAFDILYVPDDVTRAALVASYLPFYNVELRTHDMMDQVSLRRKYRGTVPSVVQLIGAEGWNHPSLIARGGEAALGALVMTVCPVDWNDPRSDVASRFAAAYSQRRGRLPGSVAAHAYDAASLLFAAVRDSVGAARPRRAIRAAALRVRLLDGACGPAHLDPDGTLRREVMLYRVGRGQMVLHEW